VALSLFLLQVFYCAVAIVELALWGKNRIVCLVFLQFPHLVCQGKSPWQFRLQASQLLLDIF